MILGRTQSCYTLVGLGVAPALISGDEIEAYFGHELLRSRAAVVTRHGVVQIFPEAFDSIVVGTVRRQEVKPQLLGRFGLHRQPNLKAVMDSVVIEDDVNPFGFRVRLRGQLVQNRNHWRSRPAPQSGRRSEQAESRRTTA